MRPPTSISLANGSSQRATRPDHQKGPLDGLCEPQKRKVERGEQVRRLPGRAHPHRLPQDQAQIEGGGVNQRTLGDVVLAAQMNPPHPARVVEVRETPVDQFSTPPPQRLRDLGVQPPPIRIHRRLGRALSDPLFKPLDTTEDGFLLTASLRTL